MGPEMRSRHGVDPHARADPAHQTLDTLNHAANGSVVEAATYLFVSVAGMFAALAAEFYGYTAAALFLIWLGGAMFTLGIIEYRRSQTVDPRAAGPEP